MDFAARARAGRRQLAGIFPVYRRGQGSRRRCCCLRARRWPEVDRVLRGEGPGSPPGCGRAPVRRARTISILLSGARPLTWGGPSGVVQWQDSSLWNCEWRFDPSPPSRPPWPADSPPSPDGTHAAGSSALTSPVRRGPGGRRGHPDALGAAQAAPPAVRSGDAALRPRLAGRLLGRPGRGRRGPRRRAGHQEAPGRGARPASSTSSSSACSGAPATPSSVGLTAFPDDADADDDHDVLVLPGDTPLLRPSTIAALVEHAPRERRRVHDPHRACSTTRPATAASCGARTTGWPASSSSSTPRPRSARSTRSTRRSTASAGRAGPGAAPPAAPERPGRVLPDRRRRGAPRRRLPGGHRGGRRPRRGGRASTTACSWPTAEAELRRRTNDAWLQQGVTMVDPDATYIDATVELAADVTLFPGTILQGTHRRRAGQRDRSRHAARRLRRRRRRRGRPGTGHDAEIGAGAIVGPYAVLRPGASIPDGTVTGPFYTAAGADVAGPQPTG